MKRRSKKRLRCLTKRQLRNRTSEYLLFYSFLQKDTYSDSSTTDYSSSEMEEQVLTSDFNHDNEFMDTVENCSAVENIEEPQYDDVDEMGSENPSEGEGLKLFLKNWALEYGVSHAQLKPLLAKLKEHECHSSLIPKDPRTLFGTPTGKTDVKNLPPGLYHHFGLKIGILNILNIHSKKIIEEIVLKIGIDGLPISKSSGAEFYPILGCLEPFSDVFLIGVYFGYEKPNSVDDFLNHFLKEAEDLCSNGLDFEDRKLNCRRKCIIADAPAKAFILNVKYHSGNYSCTKCRIKGKYKKHRVCFPYTGRLHEKRTDADIRYFKDKKH